MSEFDQVSYWIDGADYDLETAKAMLQTKRFLYVGFMCHQTVEKALKGLYVSRYSAEKLPYVHQLGRLSEAAGIVDELNADQKRLLAQLNPLNIEARYPGYRDALLASLTSELSSQLIRETEDMLQWIKEML